MARVCLRLECIGQTTSNPGLLKPTEHNTHDISRSLNKSSQVGTVRVQMSRPGGRGHRAKRRCNTQALPPRSKNPHLLRTRNLCIPIGAHAFPQIFNGAPESQMPRRAGAWIRAAGTLSQWGAGRHLESRSGRHPQDAKSGAAGK